jgi:DNA topoisomerase VI subunit B
MSKKAAGEIQVQKSPAEFFAENQAIAGFDNLGKSLYTSIRELVENGLDACESIGELPTISLHVTEYTQSEFNKLAGIGTSPRKLPKDAELFETKTKKGRKKSVDPASGEVLQEDAAPDPGDKKKKRKAADAYFRITVRDTGCGMQHDAIPNLFGRVLSGSKYGVRQTRGKFGLGAKMALIWAKKSSGQPIRIVTAHRPSGGGTASHVSTCVLDIDIYKNEPKIIEHTKAPNKDNWIGTEVSVLVAGNWATYKSRIVQYIQQLAIITPYANLSMTYDNASDPKRAMKLDYDRRSEQMPPPAKEVKHHPSSVNNLVVQQLIRYTKTKTLSKFFANEFSCVSPVIAKRLIDELGSAFDEDMHPSELTDKQIMRIVQLFRQVQLFKAPDGSCLSPLGEYNLSLGIQKVLEPDMIATARDKVRIDSVRCGDCCEPREDISLTFTLLP